MDFHLLRDAGLTDGEIKVYTALLGIGSSTTGPIVEKSKISRSIVYQILENLIDKGLASYIIKDKTKYFQAAQPQKILDYIDERQKSLLQNREKIAGILPQLSAVQNTSKMHSAQIFEGFKGIQTVHEKMYDRLKRGDDFFYFGVPSFQDEKYHRYWQKDHLRRIKAGITCKLLVNRGADPWILENRNSYKGCDARYMPIEVETPAWFAGYKDVTIIGLQSEEGMAIEIIDPLIAKSFLAYFNAFWNMSKPFKPANTRNPQIK